MNRLKETTTMMTTKNVLVCEDDPVQLKVLTSLINLAGYRSLSAQTPAEAMIQARRCGIDAVVTDVVLPDGNGFDLVNNLRRLGYDAPVFMTSAHATEGMKDRARDAGVKFFFEKPFSLRSIRDRVDAVLQKSKTKDGTVLLVESDARVRGELGKVIAEAGFQVDAVEGGDGALARLASGGRVDILLMDPHASGTSGAALVRKAREAAPGLHVVMISDEAGRDEIRAGYEAGAASLIRKSIRAERLGQFLTGTFHAVVAAREKREEGRKRSERRAAESPLRKALRWIKSYLHAPGHSRKGGRLAGLLFIVLGAAAGVGGAAALEASYQEGDRLDARAARAMERIAAPSERPGVRQAEAFGRLQVEEQLRLMREANTFTSRYYEGHLEELRRQGSTRTSAEPVVEWPMPLRR
jgi:DNA-binding response OmpR family regulator